MLYTRMNHISANSPNFRCMSLHNVKYILVTLPMKSLYTAVIFVFFGFPLAYYFDITLGIACEWIAEEVYECPPDLYSFYYAAYGYLLLALLAVFALSFFINGNGFLSMYTFPSFLIGHFFFLKFPILFLKAK
eukprot:UN26873